MASTSVYDLPGKVALVTGGTRGIGRAVAAAYLSAGARVFICGRDEKRLAAALRELQAIGEIDGAALDLGAAKNAKELARRAAERFGAIDVLVNNASVLGPRVSIADYPEAAWEEVLRINLSGVFFLTREVLPLMSARKTGSIVNVTSGVGRRGKARWGAYAVAKAGIECFTQVLADEVKADAIRVNAVNPAATRTAMRAAAYPDEDPLTLPRPEDVVEIFLYLASDASSAITGRSLDARDWARGIV